VKKDYRIALAAVPLIKRFKRRHDPNNQGVRFEFSSDLTVGRVEKVGTPTTCCARMHGTWTVLVGASGFFNRPGRFSGFLRNVE
jgi:hypothetical protein